MAKDYFSGTEYSVSFDADGGELIGETKLTSETIFSGWALSEDGVAIYNDEDVILNLTNVEGTEVTLYAVWNTGIVRLPDAKRTGYVFKGWWTKKGEDGEVIGQGDTSFTPKTDMVLYAQYEPVQYRISYNLNLPENAFSSVLELPDQECVYDKESTISDIIPEVDGYIFEGWSRDRGTEGCALEPEYQPGVGLLNLTSEMDEEIILFAIWRGKEYTVNFLSAEENGELVSSIKLVYGEESELPEDILKEIASLNDNLIFKYWKDSAGKIYSSGQIIKNLTTEDSINMYAIWENMNEATMNYDDTQYNPPESILEPSTEECQTDQQPEPQLHHYEE